MVARNDNSKQNQMSRDLCDTILAFDDFNDSSWQDKWTLSAYPDAPLITEHDGYLDIPSWFDGGQELTFCFEFLSQPIMIESCMMHFESYESQSVIGL